MDNLQSVEPVKVNIEEVLKQRTTIMLTKVLEHVPHYAIVIGISPSTEGNEDDIVIASTIPTSAPEYNSAISDLLDEVKKQLTQQ
jgi:hypothetical protein